MQTKDDVTPAEGPKRRRGAKSAAAEVDTAAEAPKKRAPRAKKPGASGGGEAAAVQTATIEAAPTEAEAPKKRALRKKAASEAAVETTAAEPRAVPASAPAVVSSAPVAMPVPALTTGVPGAEAQAAAGTRPSRHERHRGQRSQPVAPVGSETDGRTSGKVAVPAASPVSATSSVPSVSAPPVAASESAGVPSAPASSPQVQQGPAHHQHHPQQHGQQHGQQHVPGQPSEPGQGRRRRRRRGRGGGGGQPGQQHGGQQHGGQQQGGHQQHHQQQIEAQLQPASGVLEMDERGFGRLRRADRNFMATDHDPDVPRHIVDRYRLRPGALLDVQVLVRNNKPMVHRVDRVEGVTPEEASNRLAFANLTSVDPDRRIQLETTGAETLTRAIDIIAPIGFGQRGLIVAPPKTGKTIILQKMAKSILTNHPKAKLMVLLIDERPEEVTDFKRSIGAEVYASSSDRPAHEHLRVAELVMDRARRMCEAGDDVVVLLDSITRLARAYNKEVESSGRTMSGGVDSRALERPKRIFGSARNTEEAGSLTIVGTALVETGSRMDEVIFEEFKGTGNMELVLDRQLAERRLFPAININASGTRKEEKLFDQRENDKIRKLRAYLAGQRPIEGMEKLLSRLKDYRSNAEFLDAMS